MSYSQGSCAQYQVQKKYGNGCRVKRDWNKPDSKGNCVSDSMPNNNILSTNNISNMTVASENISSILVKPVLASALSAAYFYLVDKDPMGPSFYKHVAAVGGSVLIGTTVANLGASSFTAKFPSLRVAIENVASPLMSGLANVVIYDKLMGARDTATRSFLEAATADAASGYAQTPLQVYWYSK